jgi:hypothetical protein
MDALPSIQKPFFIHGIFSEIGRCGHKGLALIPPQLTLKCLFQQQMCNRLCHVHQDWPEIVSQSINIFWGRTGHPRPPHDHALPNS